MATTAEGLGQHRLRLKPVADKALQAAERQKNENKDTSQLFFVAHIVSFYGR